MHQFPKIKGPEPYSFFTLPYQEKLDVVPRRLKMLIKLLQEQGGILWENYITLLPFENQIVLTKISDACVL